MGSGERSGSGSRDDWRGRITTGVGVAACMAGAMLLGPVVGINGFWPGMLAIAVAIIVGIVLGRLVGGLLFRPNMGQHSLLRCAVSGSGRPDAIKLAHLELPGALGSSSQSSATGITTGSPPLRVSQSHQPG